MTKSFFYLLLISSFLSFGQKTSDNEKAIASKLEAQNLVYEANNQITSDDFITAEMSYRKALSESPSYIAGSYNLAHSYYKKENYKEALFRAQEAIKAATNKEEKHKAYHNIGNILMKEDNCKEAVEAFKNALRNNPNDEETRYNFAIAKDCADQKQDGGGEDEKEDDKEDKKEEEEKKDNKDKGEDEKKDGDEEEDEKGKPKDDKKDPKEENKKDNKKQKPQPGKMSPQQIKNILEAMQNQEQKVQEKMNAEKQKGAPVKTKKDW